MSEAVLNMRSVVIDIPDSACPTNNLPVVCTETRHNAQDANMVVPLSTNANRNELQQNSNALSETPSTREMMTVEPPVHGGQSANTGFSRIYSVIPILNRFRNNVKEEPVPSINTNTDRNCNSILPTQISRSYVDQNGRPVMTSLSTQDYSPPVVDFNAPPPYDPPSKLPTYEEVQREKALQGEITIPMANNFNMPDHGYTQAAAPHSLRMLTTGPNTLAESESKLLGTDLQFLMAFMIALFFNWIGFLMLMCFCHTVAARYGALSGFGLSLAKWTIIVKGASHMEVQNTWLWWLITAFGFLICVRSIIQYVHIKRGWRLMSAATQERLLFFY